MLTLFWVSISAVAVALIAPMVAHAIKLADFRQAWINDLRKDIADYIGLCGKWVRVYDDLNELNDQAKEAESKELFSTATEALVILWRIEMRINPLENKFKQEDDSLIASLRDLLNPGAIPPSDASDLVPKWRGLAEIAVGRARAVLKREWEVTNSTESQNRGRFASRANLVTC